MPSPVFASADSPRPLPPTLSRTQVAASLGVNGPAVDKMVRAHLLEPPFRADRVADLALREQLRVVENELTVLRTDAKAPAEDGRQPVHDTRTHIGFDVELTDDELEASSLRWWRCDPLRVIENELLAVTIATFPVAVYAIREVVDTHQRDGEAWQRYHFSGVLLARVFPGLVVRTRPRSPGLLREKALQIMASRIAVESGGPIGYLGAP